MKNSLPKVRDHMDTRQVRVSPDAKVVDAMGYLLQHGVTGVPVVSENGALVGMFTERDCLTLIAHSADPQHSTAKVREYMTADPVTVRPDMDVYFVAGKFLNFSFRRFPVVADDGKLLGVITRFDILRVIEASLTSFSR